MSKNLTPAFLFLLVTSIVSTSQNAMASRACLLNHHESLIERPTVQKWLTWEISPTIKNWNQERATSPLPIARVAGNSVNVEILAPEYVKGLEDALDNSKSTIPWFQHPYNQDADVPNFAAVPIEYGTAYHTASRTIVTEVGSRTVSLKMATDHPFGPNRDYQPGKVDLDADLKYSVARSKAILQIDRQIGEDPELLIQKEIAAVIDKKTGNGFLFRDMSIFEDGNYYLPGHQIPYLGAEFSQHWPAMIGRMQAKLLYRYAIEVRAVNPQNFLMQIDAKTKKPTGAGVWRDLAESHLIESLAIRLGLKEYVDRDKKNGGWGVHQHVTIDNYNIYWRFNDVKPSLTQAQMVLWSKVHDQAYKDELKKALGIEIPENAVLSAFLNTQLQDPNSDLNARILKWHETQRKKMPKSSRWIRESYEVVLPTAA